MSSFWKNKKVFITGHTGFKGSWLSLWLSNMGADVYGYSLLPNKSKNLFNILDIPSLIKKSIIGDIRDLDFLIKNIKECDPEIVFHMAAQPLVRLSYNDPIETFSTNVIGTANVMESLKACSSLKSSVIITSDKCYENKETFESYTEDDPMGGHDPYSASKGCSELVISSYKNSFFSSETYDHHGNAVASARAGNVIGGGDWSDDRLIPDAIKCFESNKTLLIRSPNAIRPWQHVLEPLNGYMILAEKLYNDGVEFSGGWNFGPSDSDNISVSDIVKIIVKIWDEKVEWKIDESKKKHEANILKLNCTKSRSRLNWKPKWNAERAIESTISWYKALASGKDMYKFSIAQIEEYNQEH